jgi:predicted RNase H-like nuclease (RuvC/YqgF family)
MEIRKVEKQEPVEEKQFEIVTENVQRFTISQLEQEIYMLQANITQNQDRINELTEKINLAKAIKD